MLRAKYRALMIGRAKSAAEKVACNLSEEQLNDIGHGRSTLVATSVQSMIKELDEADKRRAQKAAGRSSRWSMSGIWASYSCKAAN